MTPARGSGALPPYCDRPGTAATGPRPDCQTPRPQRAIAAVAEFDLRCLAQRPRGLRHPSGQTRSPPAATRHEMPTVSLPAHPRRECRSLSRLPGDERSLHSPTAGDIVPAQRLPKSRGRARSTGLGPGWRRYAGRGSPFTICHDVGLRGCRTILDDRHPATINYRLGRRMFKIGHVRKFSVRPIRAERRSAVNCGPSFPRCIQ